MKPKTLRLYAVGDKLINDHDALVAGTCRYIGRKWDPILKGWPASDEPTEVKTLSEYVIAVKHGDLLPADEATAEYCQVPFQPRLKATAVAANQTQFNGKY